MPQLHITGWRHGLQKVSMTVLLRRELLSLAEAKACTDAVLEGETVVLDVDDLPRAQEIARRLDALGAEVEVRP